MSLASRSHSLATLGLACFVLHCGSRVTPTEDARDADAVVPAPDAPPADVPDADVPDATTDTSPPYEVRQPTEALDERVTRRAMTVSNNARSIAVATNAACVRTLANTVACWGSNATGALADPDRTRYAVVAETIPGLSDVVSLASTGTGFCATRASGSLWCWGGYFSASAGGDEFRFGRPLAQLVEAPRAQDVYGAPLGLCVRDELSNAWCWGLNFADRLGPFDDALCGGDASMVVRACVRDPRVLAAQASSVSCGFANCCLVDGAGAVRCAGDNGSGQLSGGVRLQCPEGPCDRSPELLRVPLPRDAAALVVTVGTTHVCALVGDGGVLCWGDNSGGQLGRGDVEPHTNVAIAQLAGATRSVKSHGLATCAVLTDGGLWCWGQPANGVLGHGPQPEGQPTPTRVALPAAVSTMDLSDTNACALLASGEVWCWGENARGFVGEGSERGPSVPPARRP